MTLLKVENVTRKFGGLTALSNVSLEVNKNEIIGLIGPNGSGKTTLFNVLSGFAPPDSGEVYLNGRPISKLKPYKINRLGLARTFQVVKPLKRLSLLENVISASFFGHLKTKKEALQIAEETIGFCGLYEKRNKRADSLTIGDRKRLEIARAMATGPTIILLDETFAGLNPKEQENSIKLVHKIKEMGVTVIIIEHVMKVIMNISDRIHVLSSGETIFSGTPDEAKKSRQVISAYLGEPLEQEK